MSDAFQDHLDTQADTLGFAPGFTGKSQLHGVAGSPEVPNGRKPPPVNDTTALNAKPSSCPNCLMTGPGQIWWAGGSPAPRRGPLAVRQLRPRVGHARPAPRPQSSRRADLPVSAARLLMYALAAVVPVAALAAYILVYLHAHP